MLLVIDCFLSVCSPPTDMDDTNKKLLVMRIPEASFVQLIPGVSAELLRNSNVCIRYEYSGH